MGEAGLLSVFKCFLISSSSKLWRLLDCCKALWGMLVAKPSYFYVCVAKFCGACLFCAVHLIFKLRGLQRSGQVEERLKKGLEDQQEKVERLDF